VLLSAGLGDGEGAYVGGSLYHKNAIRAVNVFGYFLRELKRVSVRAFPEGCRRGGRRPMTFGSSILGRSLVGSVSLFL
jgi:hypothetical protein